MHVEARVRVPVEKVVEQVAELTGKTAIQVAENFEELQYGEPVTIQTTDWDALSAILKEGKATAKVTYWPPGRQSRALKNPARRNRKHKRK